MKKLFALLLAVAMVLSMAACTKTDDNKNNDENNTDPVNVPASALEVLETIWGKMEAGFPIIGGNMESPVDGAPGNYDMAYAENLTYNLLVPEDQLANIDEAATMIHMMNANTFTCGVVHLVEGTDAAAFAQVMRDAIQGNMWMCGFPETLLVASVYGEYVVIAFGVNDAMNPFMTHFAEAYPEAEILFNEAVEG